MYLISPVMLYYFLLAADLIKITEDTEVSNNHKTVLIQDSIPGIALK